MGMRFGDLEDRYRIISDDAEVDALVEHARTALSERPIVAFTLRRLAFDVAIFGVNGAFGNRTLNQVLPYKALTPHLDRASRSTGFAARAESDNQSPL